MFGQCWCLSVINFIYTSVYWWSGISSGLLHPDWRFSRPSPEWTDVSLIVGWRGRHRSDCLVYLLPSKVRGHWFITEINGSPDGSLFDHPVDTWDTTHAETAGVLSGDSGMESRGQIRHGLLADWFRRWRSRFRVLIFTVFTGTHFESLFSNCHVETELVVFFIYALGSIQHNCTCFLVHYF